MAAEVGYAFSGLSTGYWPRLAEWLGTDLNSDDREGLVAAFRHAHREYGFVSPDDTTYARHYRLIVWPLANAIAPRQIHREIAHLLRQIALRVSLDDTEELAAAVTTAASRRGSPRLVDWASNGARSAMVARLLLSRDMQPEESDSLCRSWLGRLQADMLRSPETRAPIAEARKRAVRRRAAMPPVTLALSFGSAAPKIDLVEIGSGTSLTVASGFGSLDAAITAAEFHERKLAIDPDADFLFWARNSVSDIRAYHWQKGNRGRIIEMDFWWLLTPEKRDEAGGKQLGKHWLYSLNLSSPDHRKILEAHGLDTAKLVVSGGAPIGFDNVFAVGAPVRIETANGEAAGGQIKIGGVQHDFDLPDESALLIDPVQSGPVTVEAAGERLSLAFEREEIAPALTVSVEPIAPLPEDLRDRRLLVHVACSQRLPGLEVRASLAMRGRRTVTSVMRLSGLPATLGPDSSLLAPLREALNDMEALPGEAKLCIDAEVDRVVVELISPDPLVAWTEEDQRWRAHDATDVHGEALTVLSVDANSTFAEPMRLESISQPASLALMLTETHAPRGGMIVAPRRFQGGFSPGINSTLPTPHRRLSRQGSAAGLVEEIEAWLAWSCAEASHILARSMAAGTVSLTENATVQTLCGGEWLRRENPEAPRLFHDHLTRIAIWQDRVGITDFRNSAVIAKEDENAFRSSLAARFATLVSNGANLRAPCDDKLAEILDEAINGAWNDITPLRAARGLEPLDPDTGNVPKDWDAVLASAREQMLRPDLASMIAPKALGEVAKSALEPATTLDELAGSLMRTLVDRGRLAGQARALGETDLALGLSLWLEPARFAGADWQYLAPRLLRDRMASRAIRLVTLLRRSMLGTDA